METNARQEAFEERAAIMEFCGGLKRAEAEARARIALLPPEKMGRGYAAFINRWHKVQTK